MTLQALTGSPRDRQRAGLESRRNDLAHACKKKTPFIKFLGFAGYFVKEMVLGSALAGVPDEKKEI